MDRLAAMRAFVEVVDAGSLTAAGASLGRSLPTMVRTLAALEAELGVVLLRRTTRQQSLTAEGRLYLERCRRILSELEEADALVGSGSGEPHGELRVTAPVLFGQMHVAPAVCAFLAAHPKVSAQVVLLDRVVDLVEEGFDVGVRIGALADSSMIATAVGQVRSVVCASPAFLRDRGVPEDPEELASRPCVRFTGTAPGPVWRFGAGRRERAIRIAGPLVTNQASVAIDACIAGLGFGRFLSYQVEPALADGRLERVLAAHEPAPAPIHLVHPDGRMASSRVRAFLDWMKPRLRARPEPD